MSLVKLIAFLLVLTALSAIAEAGVVEGTVSDHDTGEPIPFATVRVHGTGQSMAANEEGLYRIRLEPGDYNLKFSHIAHYSESIAVSIGDETNTLDIKLKPSIILLKGLKAYTRAYDPGQRIILEAIARKREILDQLGSYSFKAYTKFVANDRKKDTNNVFLIAESQIEAFWEKPDKYKEIIKSRRQTANIEGANNFLSVGRLLNFNANRLDIGPYLLVSPTAKDAFEYYDYYLLDTLYQDDRAVFRLEIEPKTKTEPLFFGTIDIADSTYEVVGVDIGVNEAFDAGYMKNLRLVQQHSEFNGKYWMPVTIRITGDLDIPIPGIPSLSFLYNAALYDYSFDLDHPDETFNEYVLEVAETADDTDSVGWAMGQVVPLTVEEIKGYKRIDSLENISAPLWKKGLFAFLGLTALTLMENDIFHYNRVEGAYLGMAIRKRKLFPRTDISLKSGWAFKGEYWQHRYGLDYKPWSKRKISIGGGYHYEIIRQQSIFSQFDSFAPLLSLYMGVDPSNYYLEEGFSLNLKTKLIKKSKLTITYNDYLQTSVSKNTDYSFFGGEDEFHDNLPIADGRLRSAKADFVFDSRPLILSKGRDFILNDPVYTLIKISTEQADPGTIDNDFHFKKYSVSFLKNWRTFGLGFSRIYLYGGISKYSLPPQRYFMIDEMGDELAGKIGFKTVNGTSFVGDRVAAFYLYHDFERRLFSKSGIPALRDIPFSIAVYGGMFWTKFENQEIASDNIFYITASKPYRELGFSVGRITPWNIRLFFTWQLSDHPGEDFSFGWNFLFD
jgi:hypothetical protein